jgi:hypothetical protein
MLVSLDVYGLLGDGLAVAAELNPVYPFFTEDAVPKTKNDADEC